MESGLWNDQGKERGMFFCAIVGERTYIRFVPGDTNWKPIPEKEERLERVVREIGTCLRLIECEPEMSRRMPASSEETVSTSG